MADKFYSDTVGQTRFNGCLAFSNDEHQGFLSGQKLGAGEWKLKNATNTSSRLVPEQVPAFFN